MKKVFLTSLALLSSTLLANEVQIMKVKTFCNKDRICTFDVTLKHNDTGWEHYANKWEIYTLDNKLLGKRVLYHPHVKEQPFTRSLSNVRIPKGINKVIVKAHDTVHKYSSQYYEYELSF